MLRIWCTDSRLPPTGECRHSYRQSLQNATICYAISIYGIEVMGMNVDQRSSNFQKRLVVLRRWEARLHKSAGGRMASEV